jgi:rhodanese-related sulfurtransferase
MKNITTADLTTPGNLPADCDFIDVREPAECAMMRWEKARNIPLGRLAHEVPQLDRNRPVVMICAAGGRSMQAASYLESQGFTQVFNLAGGMGQASRDGLPTISGR